MKSSAVKTDGARAPRLRPIKREKIIAAASARFIANGFDKTSMDDIARTGGVSKATVYMHFKDKESLFLAIIQHRAADLERLYSKLTVETLTGVKERLIAVAMALLASLSSKDVLELFRVAIAEGPRYPQLANYLRGAPEHYVNKVILTILQEQADGQSDSRPGDGQVSAFLAMAVRSLLWEMLLDGEFRPSRAHMRRHVTLMTEAFLAVRRQIHW